MTTRALPQLPRPAAGDPDSMMRWAHALTAAIELQFQTELAPGGSQSYTVTNLTPSHALNAGTATATQVAEVVGTLIGDLQELRIID